MSIIAILTAGGTGTRTHQDLPKQFITVENKPIIIYTLEAFQQHPSIDEIYVTILFNFVILNCLAYASRTAFHPSRHETYISSILGCC